MIVGDAGGSVHIGGVKRCGSPWACPVCTPAIGARRAEEVNSAISEAVAQGYTPWFVTATLPHYHQENLKTVLGELLGAWRRTFSGGAAQRWRGEVGFLGSIKAVETTYGRNGWHPHIHAVVLTKAENLDSSFLAERWANEVTRTGRASPSTQHGFDVRGISDSTSLGAYLTKLGSPEPIGNELVRADLKKGRRSSLTPFQLISLAATTGDKAPLGLFLEYESATFGRNALVWSKGLKAQLGVEDVTDDEAVTTEAAEPFVFWRLTADDWNELEGAGLVAPFLDACELQLAGLLRERLPVDGPAEPYEVPIPSFVVPL